MTTTPRNNVSKPSVSQFNAFRSDMFGRTKVSEPLTIFDSTHRYVSDIDAKYSDLTATGGTVTYNINQSSDFLNVTTASGSSVSRESKRVFLYQPGKSLQVLQSFVFAPAKTNLRQRAGYFSRTNGVFLEQVNDEVFFVLRSFASGQIVETRVPQSEWNMDPLDGSGPSDRVLDLTKSQLLWSEYEWLGVGSVRIGFALDGVFVACHQFNHANIIQGVYMQTAKLPVRYEIENIGPTESNSSLQQICTTVVINGGYENRPTAYTDIFSSGSNISVGTSYVFIGAIRLHPNRMDAIVLPGQLDIVPTASGVFEYQFIENATITGGTWVHHSSGTVQLNKTATSLTGGRILRTGIINSTNQGPTRAGLEGLDRFANQLGRTNSDTPISDTYALKIRTLGGNSSVNGSFTWFDLT
jgi:hypothetical protein